MIGARIALLAPFHPVTTIDTQSQQDFYAMMKDTLDRLFDAPELMFATLTPDDAYPNRFNCASYGKPELQNRMRAIDKKLDELLDNLIALGQSSAPENDGLRLAQTPSKK